MAHDLCFPLLFLLFSPVSSFPFVSHLRSMALLVSFHYSFTHFLRFFHWTFFFFGIPYQKNALYVPL